MRIILRLWGLRNEKLYEYNCPFVFGNHFIEISRTQAQMLDRMEVEVVQERDDLEKEKK